MESARNHSCNGRNEYEWDQSFDDLTLYLGLPSNVTKNQIKVQFKPSFVQIQVLTEGEEARELRGELFSTIEASESFWVIQDSELEVHLAKAITGQVWECVFKGDAPLTGFAKEDEKKKLLLERFQKEHPSFDFSDATLNGMVPEPRTFMR